VFFAFADRRHERRVSAGARHEEDVRIGAAIEEHPGNRDRVLGHARERQPRRAQVHQRLPAFRSEVLQPVVARRLFPLKVGRVAECGGRARTLREHTFNFTTIAAHDFRAEAIVRDIRVTREQAHRRALSARVRCPAADMMIGTRILEKPLHALRLRQVARRLRLNVTFQLRPASILKSFSVLALRA